jgi:hypothetical protein
MSYASAGDDKFKGYWVGTTKQGTSWNDNFPGWTFATESTLIDEFSWI